MRISQLVDSISQLVDFLPYPCSIKLKNLSMSQLKRGMQHDHSEQDYTIFFKYKFVKLIRFL